VNARGGAFCLMQEVDATVSAKIPKIIRELRMGQA
jgi:hypothetical protein